MPAGQGTALSGTPEHHGEVVFVVHQHHLPPDEMGILRVLLVSRKALVVCARMTDILFKENDTDIFFNCRLCIYLNGSCALALLD
jgi:hypothetical protein